jgi:dihydrofolate synthase/folylpolyglutamate synthase
MQRPISTVELPGRFQVLPGRPVVVLDVAHNPHAAAVLAENLGSMGVFARTHVVVGMLRDKDISAVCGQLRNRVSHWYACTLDEARGAGATEVAGAIVASGSGGAISEHASPRSAFVAAREAAGQGDRIVVFGSFHTVADVMAFVATSRR